MPNVSPLPMGLIPAGESRRVSSVPLPFSFYRANLPVSEEALKVPAVEIARAIIRHAEEPCPR